MSTISPRITDELATVDDFYSFARSIIADESSISGIKCGEERISDGDFYQLDIRMSVFDNCTFHWCNFEKSCFIDTIFQSCDLSNSTFSGAYFERCRFVSCKCIGIDMNETVVKQTSFEQSNLQYSVFNRTKMTDVLFDHTDFGEASMAESKLKKFVANDSRFVRNNFFKTLLAGVDFTGNEFVAPIVSTPPVELKGVIVDVYQAAGLISLWGVVVKL